MSPFSSRAQQRFLAVHPEKIGGKKAFHEWASKTNFRTLPEKVKPPKKAGK
jgi:hypothetical protein